jgi:hypothetical protein
LHRVPVVMGIPTPSPGWARWPVSTGRHRSNYKKLPKAVPAHAIPATAAQR